MGDGEKISLSPEELKTDLLVGSEDAAERGRIPRLSDDEIETLFDIFTDPSRMVSVSRGQEVVMTDDGAGTLLYGDSTDAGQSVPVSQMASLLAYERAYTADTASMAAFDYSAKPVKSIIGAVATEYYTTSQLMTIPLFYGFQPNMGLYFKPDGPYPNPTELMPDGKIATALQAQERAARHLKKDIVYIATHLHAVGCGSESGHRRVFG